MINKINKANKRQEEILSLLSRKGEVSIAQILDSEIDSLEKISKVTINRDLEKLIQDGYIISKGKGKAVIYILSPYYNFIKSIDTQKYFNVEPDKRKVREKFNFEIFSILDKINIFTDKELIRLEELNEEYQKNLKSIPKSLLKKEFERLSIELSWKSSKIEGNTYSLLETEFLIKEHIESPKHTKEEAIMILNHKKALDYIRKNEKNFKTITLSKIEDIHYLLIQQLGISRNLRKIAVGITGTKYKPLDNEFQIKEVAEKTCRLINRKKSFFAKALLLSLLVAYIQPFEDGNKRTSRLISNAVLLAHGACPLSYRSIDEVEYKKAIILFYEQNNINYFKEIFIEQFEFAVKNYFRVHA